MTKCNVYDVGDKARVFVTFTDPATGDPTDPSDVSLKFVDPSGNETEWVWGVSPELSNPSEGQYEAHISLDEAGYWTYIWIGSGTDAPGVEQATFYVRPVDVGTITTGYSSRQDIYNIYGTHNVNKWADLNNDGVESDIVNRINWAITRADAEIDSRLNGGPWDLPFVAPIDPIITDLSARYAGVLLYESRGITDAKRTNQNFNHELSVHRNQVMRELNQLLAGQRGLSTVNRNYTYWPENILSD